jgi:hypothetical protein
VNWYGPQAAPGPLENEYFKFAAAAHYGNAFWHGEIQSDRYDQDAGTARTRGRVKYAWAIPNEAALTALLSLGPLIEIGAGCGYWAHLLRERGGDIVAYDINPPNDERHSNGWCKHTFEEPRLVGTAWTTVLRGGPSVLKQRRHRERALFLCWPPYDEPIAHVALRTFRGDTFAFVGEQWGATGNAAFFRLLASGWLDVREVTIPRWENTHDTLTIWKRKKPTARA